MSILVTGGMGYIGSHTSVELLNAGEDVIIIDNLVNSKETVKEKIEQITGKNIKLYKIDLTDKNAVENVFKENKIDAVMDFAALKAVGESVSNPLEYYNNNLTSILIVLELMKKYSVRNLVFSSSATVYGDANIMPVNEEYLPLSVTNPYGRTKLIAEDILRDLSASNDWWNIAILRYFNPIGAHESGIIGEDPSGIPSNIMPYITEVAIGTLKEVSIFGSDYDTPDGTGVRDYIHVVDIAEGHVKALEMLKKNPGLITYNLGTGTGYSVLELIATFEKVAGVEIPYKIVERRVGDVAICYADSSKANKELNWKAKRSLEEMCKDSWAWQVKNPNGYK
ncbi:UDP-glucose 4-epimerase [Clostridium puniceum]|uniref:UDP-glucose 4-epimerase n=1 Tax=Clostridium puniceum TaxID=29367 RepID=A0A1S8TI24_9CLOT|nr:UDP-glucose 4-epimerase GalE [Clostridium puniceum]OOM77254.1 UDP-glucose 4-epimerase [Clostridium puniceum]